MHGVGMQSADTRGKDCDACLSAGLRECFPSPIRRSESRADASSPPSATASSTGDFPSAPPPLLPFPRVNKLSERSMPWLLSSAPSRGRMHAARITARDDPPLLHAIVSSSFSLFFEPPSPSSLYRRPSELQAGTNPEVKTSSLKPPHVPSSAKLQSASRPALTPVPANCLALSSCNQVRRR
jgi:hypothetical protein